MKETKVKKSVYLGMPLLDISKTYMNFGMDSLNQNIKTK